FFFSSRRRHTRFSRDWSSDVCSSDLVTRALRQDTLLEWLRRQARFKKDLPEGAELAARRGEGGLPEDEVPAVSDEEIFRVLREEIGRASRRDSDVSSEGVTGKKNT